jgi:hypothetical protein
MAAIAEKRRPTEGRTEENGGRKPEVSGKRAESTRAGEGCRQSYE